GILREIPKLEESLVISAALEKLLRERTHIALVVDSNNAITGMITLEDIMEELLGDIQDEYDLLPLHVVRSGEGWLSGGGASIQRLRSVTGLAFATDDPSQNLNHWVEAHLGHPPVGGDVVNVGDVRILVRKVRRQRVLEAFVSRVR
ncbi:MAG: transporter associated domain-containing protein, partial [Planctomycetota bacterium]